MAAGPWTFTNSGRTSLLNGDFNLSPTGSGGDTFKIALFTSSSNLGPTSTTYALLVTDGNEVATNYGYTRNAKVVTITLTGTTSVTVDGSNPAWLAAGGTITARRAAIYENNGNVLCYCLLDSTNADVSVTSGNTLTIEMNAAGIFSLT